APGQAGSAFLATQIEIAHDAIKLFLRDLSTDHGICAQRVASADFFYSGNGFFNELIVDGFLDEDTRGAGADFALIEGKHGQAFDGFFQKCIVLFEYIRKINVGTLATELDRGGNEVIRSLMQDELAHRG